MYASTRLHRIVRRLLLRSFPRLRRLNLTVAWGAENDLLIYSVHGDAYRIAVNDDLHAAPTRVLEGGLMHELCHIDADLRWGPFQRKLAWRRYFDSLPAHIREERATERRVVELGYAAELLAFARYAHRLGYRFTREHGLLYHEIVGADAQERSRRVLTSASR